MWQLLLKNKYLVIVIGIFLFELFLRFYQMDIKNAFGYDQVDNAWAAKNIIVNHNFPLIGMAAKANSGISIAPVYYYLIAVIYWATNLNPIASAIMGGITSIFSFWVLFYVSKKLFSKEVAVIAIFIYTFVMQSILWDRVQVPTNFIAPIGLLIFYVLYRITQGDVKKIIILAALVGFSFNIHFTSVFYPIMILLTLPFFPKTRETLKYILISIPVFLIWMLPVIVAVVGHNASTTGAASYLQTNYHGFHLRRVFQLMGDGLIQFEQYLFINVLKPLKYIAIPVFYIIFLFKSVSRAKLIFCYLVLLWFIVPWFGFATYSGEITDYYFSISRFIALIIVAYFFGRVWAIRNVAPKIAVIVVLIYIAFVNLEAFFPYKDVGLAEKEKTVLQTINQGGKVKFQIGVPESYIYYYYMRQKGIDPYAVKK